MRRTFSVAALVAIIGSAAFLAAGPATAQTQGYPPKCNTADIPQDAGTHNVGETFKVVLLPNCIFTPGASVAVTVNGTSVGTKIADASGAVTVTVTVVSATELSIDDPVKTVARCGADLNSAVAVGPSQAASGVNVTQTATFKVNCPGAGGGGGGVVAPPRRVAFTGANIAKWAALALVLVGIGAVLVTLNRRRSQAGS